MADKFMIAPVTVGLQTDVRPWLLPDSAFATLNNAVVFFGRVRKRFGSAPMNSLPSPQFRQLYSRLRINIGTTAAVSGNFSATVPGAVFNVGQQFSIGNTVLTVPSLGAPVTLLTTGAATGTYNTTTGALVITGNTENPLTAVYFYPATPVMGFVDYENSTLINQETLFAFDTQFSYYFTGTQWENLSTAAAGTWTGTDYNFPWATNYRGIAAYNNYLFVVNYNPTDRVRYYDGANWNILTGAGIQYDSSAGDEIYTARIVLSFKGRLLLLNTVEFLGSTASLQTYTNRVRYCQVGDPVSAGQTPWREDIGGKGGFIDAPTKQAIISARILKDRLIVYFEESTYELVYQGNQELPFTFQQINAELGVESTFSTVTFDRSIIGVGNIGVHACNGAYVERIDDKIPTEVFNVKVTGNEMNRIYGVRDFFNQMVYWAIPSVANANTVYPNQVLVYNYQNGTWAMYDDSITAFGYVQRFEQLPTGIKDVLAGNQEGFTFVCNADEFRNSAALQISKIIYATPVVTLTVINHNLSTNDFVAIENAQGLTGINNAVYEVTVVDANTFTINLVGMTGTYTGLGTVARVSRIDILTKQYNFYSSNDRNCHVKAINFFVDRTDTGVMTVDFLPYNFSTNPPVPLTSMILETFPYTLYPIELLQTQLWHAVYPNAEGNLIQLRIYQSDAQLLASTMDGVDFEMHAMLFTADSTTNRLQ